MRFGEYLRKRREAHTWTQPIAASKAGIEQSYLSKLESGKSIPSEDVFDKLSKIYAIDLDDLIGTVVNADLMRLRDIKAIGTIIDSREARKTRLSRTWLIVGVFCLALGGACLGIAITPNSPQVEYHYRSQGVLLPGEALTTFSAIDSASTALQTDNAEALVARIDQDNRFFPEPRGDSYVENIDEGKRFYELIDKRYVAHSPYRQWFLAPALALMLGGLGCLAVSRTWYR